ncbi:unannotated protein [freshwater metagenome]|uniref:Unannotated protein n=1 Tax=freshwater metagenome TaxID=449393 RepID=A0A6J6X4F7_9ZZZZ
MSTGLLLEPLGGVENDQGHVGRAGAGGHIAGVLDVTGTVGNYKLASRGGGVAVGHVNGDALVALGTKTICHEAEVEVTDATLGRSSRHGLELVIEELAGVDEESTNERRLSVVHTADGGKTQEVGGRFGH